VKVTVKFIRKGICFQRTESGLSLEQEQPGQGERRRKRKRLFPFPTQEMGAKTPKVYKISGVNILVHSYA
jgi:hypothetical protein